jgi:16S rRNA processing protein RimM
LPDDEYYHADLIGLPAISTEGEALGECVAVENFGAGDVIEIRKADGKKFMVPMKPQAVPEWTDERIVIEAGWAE